MYLLKRLTRRFLFFLSLHHAGFFSFFFPVFSEVAARDFALLVSLLSVGQSPSISLIFCGVVLLHL